jgi:hypothetical protein
VFVTNVLFTSRCTIHGVAFAFYPLVKMQNGLIPDNSVVLANRKVDVGLFLKQRVLQQAGVQSFLSASKPSGKNHACPGQALSNNGEALKDPVFQSPLRLQTSQKQNGFNVLKRS